MDAYFSQLHISPTSKDEQSGYSLSNKDFQGLKLQEATRELLRAIQWGARLAFPAFLGHPEPSASGAVDNFDSGSFSCPSK